MSIHNVSSRGVGGRGKIFFKGENGDVDDSHDLIQRDKRMCIGEVHPTFVIVAGLLNISLADSWSVNYYSLSLLNIDCLLFYIL